jgi:hypothetical protein
MSSKAPVLTSPACEQTIVGPFRARELETQLVDQHPSLVVDSDRAHAVRAEPDEPQRAVERAVPLRTCDDGDRRCADQAVLLDVMSCLGEHVVPRREQRCCMGHLAAGDEGERRVCGQAEQLLQPAAGHLLDDRCGGRGEGEARVLVPGGGEPVGGHGRGDRAADDEAEVAAAAHLGQAGVDVASELLDDRDRVGRLLGKGQVERLSELVERCGGRDWALGDGFDVLDSKLGGALQCPATLHRASLLPLPFRGPPGPFLS